METRNIFLVVLISLLFAFSSNVKADTLTYQLPGNAQVCQDSLNFDTFVFYKPLGFGSTVWYVDFTLVGSGDSILFTPTSAGEYAIQATWNSNVEGFMLSIYTDSPSHADFQVLSGGQMNATGDTAWMCSPSISLGSNTVGSEDTYYTWYGPGGIVNSFDDPITVTTSGTWIFERGNPCGVTVDTVEVVALATTLPVFTDTTFCNASVALLLDGQPGFTTYEWSTTETDQTIFVTAPGTYSVTVANACISGSDSITVSQEIYPTPDLLYQMGLPMCSDSVLVLDPSPGYTYDSYQWAWTGGSATTSTLSISSSTGTGMYSVTVTEGVCSDEASATFDFYNPPAEPEICIVSVDISINKNMIVWTSDNEPLPGDLSYSPIVSYNVYKATSGWQLIGNVPVNQEHTFTDMSSSPPIVSALYKISAIDDCGIESSLSWYHKTILLAVNQGANSGEIPLLWNDYIDESGNFVVDQYFIYRGDSAENLHLLDSVSGFITSYIDTGVYTQKFYQIVVTKAGGCDPSPGGSKSIITSISSNITNNVLTDVSLPSSEISLSIYPNPSFNGIFYIEGKAKRVDVMDNLGSIVMSLEDVSIIDLSAYGSGVYYARVSTKQGSTIQKLVK